MTAKKIWLLINPFDANEVITKLSEPDDSGELFENEYGNTAWAEYKEFIVFPVEDFRR
ncbi:hypothetical protein IT774_07755 [Salinimonas marina]|uniref:Uncharacterized protein n=1 Tax=Salinimonas marina TaxID=2785918 RepID=A0A7S9DZW7_9ALTE|nr:hypothetical protein [Salinimonas marina]QPG06990.1 hypothetical protein IT774_07755 [Salinimonas marina]